MKWLTLQYLSKENKGIAEGFIAHHLPAQSFIHLQKTTYSGKLVFLRKNNTLENQLRQTA